MKSQLSTDEKNDVQEQDADKPRCRCVDMAGDEPTCPVHYPDGTPEKKPT